MMYPVAILAGGCGTRLGQLTESTPKVLIDVAGEPFIFHQLRQLSAAGIERVVLCVGHFAEQVVRAVGDGRKFGLSVDYSNDGDWLLGTGGAVRNALPLLGTDFFVLYGDSWLQCDYSAVAAAFEAGKQRGRSALMTVYRNCDLGDRSNVVFADGTVLVYDKAVRRVDMDYIDYGLSVFSAEVFNGYQTGERFDLSELCTRLAHSGQLAGFEVQQRFYEIGSMAGLAETARVIAGEGR